MTPTPQSEHFSIRDLADAFAITTRTIRFYEAKGLISPERQGQRRIYTKRDRARLKLVLRGKRLGFSLEEIRLLVGLYATPDDKIPQLERYLATLQAHQATLRAQRQDLDETLTELARAEQDCLALLAQSSSVPQA
ncbi:MerR family DNA-binding transcriptional regulator [Reinekea sp.]|jgi:DNA-binding transcriptional MerR regulator|uniref:MerR family transcriptional regulator n=1 Tax=Reinekea sp. TaxID=1970455 RepID=UPI002A833198|nr:MerR family DNA-binding transcriptional regulator [Reinekea sp.]